MAGKWGFWIYGEVCCRVYKIVGAKNFSPLLLNPEDPGKLWVLIYHFLPF
jgi:hypothetical protein